MTLEIGLHVILTDIQGAEMLQGQQEYILGTHPSIILPGVVPEQAVEGAAHEADHQHGPSALLWGRP